MLVEGRMQPVCCCLPVQWAKDPTAVPWCGQVASILLGRSLPFKMLGTPASGGQGGPPQQGQFCQHLSFAVVEFHLCVCKRNKY